MANVTDAINKIKNATFGKEVRSSIADGIDAVNKEIIDTTERQNDLDAVFTNLVINAGNNNSEVVAGRYDAVTNQNFDTIGKRMDNHSSRLEDLTDYLNYMPINGGDFDGNDNTHVSIDGGTY